MKTQIRRGGRRVAHALAPTAMDSVSDVPRLRNRVNAIRDRLVAVEKRLESSPDLGREGDQLRARVDELEAEVQENRRLNGRLAELTDVVQELLLPIDQRDEQALDERLEGYSKGL